MGNEKTVLGSGQTPKVSRAAWRRAGAIVALGATALVGAPSLGSGAGPATSVAKSAALDPEAAEPAVLQSKSQDRKDDSSRSSSKGRSTQSSGSTQSSRSAGSRSQSSGSRVQERTPPPRSESRSSPPPATQRSSSRSTTTQRSSSQDSAPQRQTPPSRTQDRSPPPNRTPPSREPPRVDPSTRTPPVERSSRSDTERSNDRSTERKVENTPPSRTERGAPPSGRDEGRSANDRRTTETDTFRDRDRSEIRDRTERGNTDRGDARIDPPDRGGSGDRSRSDVRERVVPPPSRDRTDLRGDEERGNGDRGDSRTRDPARSPLVPGSDRGAPSQDDLRRRLEVGGRPNSGATAETIRERFRDRDAEGRPVADRDPRLDLGRPEGKPERVRTPSRALPIRDRVDASPRLDSRNPGLRRLPREGGRGDLVDPNRFGEGRVEGDAWFHSDDYNHHHESEDYWHHSHYDYHDRCYHPGHADYYDFHCYRPSWCFSFGLRFGYDFGFVFCRDSFGFVTNIYWYYRYPGFRACYVPYSYYYRPSCHYYPSYLPTYSTVYYVEEHVVEAEAMPELPSSEPIDPNLDITGLMDLGWKLFGNGDYAGGAEAFRQATLKAPDDPWAKFAFAQALFAIGNYPDAAFLLRRGMELEPGWARILLDPRDRYGDVGDHQEQMLALSTFLEFVPGDPSALLLLSVQQFATGDLDAARKGFEELRDLDPDDLVAVRFLEALDAKGR